MQKRHDFDDVSVAPVHDDIGIARQNVSDGIVVGSQLLNLAKC